MFGGDYRRPSDYSYRERFNADEASIGYITLSVRSSFQHVLTSCARYSMRYPISRQRVTPGTARDIFSFVYYGVQLFRGLRVHELFHRIARQLRLQVPLGLVRFSLPLQGPWHDSLALIFY